MNVTSVVTPDNVQNSSSGIIMAEALEASRISRENLLQYLHGRNIVCEEDSGTITVDLTVYTLTGTPYKLRLYIPRDFPDSLDPDLAVVHPPCPQQRNGTAIPHDSPEFGTLGRTSDGYQILSVSYSRATRSAAVFLHQIFIEGTLWVNAYEEHIATGVNLAQHIQQCRRVENEGHVTTVEYLYLHTECRLSESTTSVQFWSDAQMKRLAREHEVLNAFFTSVEWSEDRRAVDVKFELSEEKTYILQVHLHHDFPNSLPILAIAHPEELLQVNGEPLPEESNEFATLKKKHDRLTICHFRPNEWMDNYDIKSVFLKGKFWIEAYEQYLEGKGDTVRDCICRLSQCSDHNGNVHNP